MKFSGEVGFYSGTKETRPGIYEPVIVERHYTGDVTRNNRRFTQTDSQNDTLNINNQINILADFYLKRNWSTIRYVVWDGAKLKVQTVEVNYPRVVLEVGGVYNG